MASDDITIITQRCLCAIYEKETKSLSVRLRVNTNSLHGNTCALPILFLLYSGFQVGYL